MLVGLTALDTALCVLVVVAGDDGTFSTYNLALQVRIEMRLDTKRRHLTRGVRITPVAWVLGAIHRART